MTLLKSKPATYADIEALPPNMVGEIIFGSLITQPRPSPRHVAASSHLGMTLGPPYGFGQGGPGGWVILDEPELHLGSHIVVPDLAGWRKERLAGRKELAWFEEVPDWICEVLSPATRAHDIGAKRRIYATFKVEHLWYIDPLATSVEVFRQQGDGWLLLQTFVGHETVSAPPFDAISFPLGQLWPFDPPPAEDDNKTGA